MNERRSASGRRESDTCLQETRQLLDRHLDDYKELLGKVDALSEKMDAQLAMQAEIRGGTKVIKFFGWLVTGGFLVTLYHALSFIFIHPKT